LWRSKDAGLVIALTPLQARIRDHLDVQFSRALTPGDRVNEAEIADQLGVSRTPVREVLLQLAAEGVVEYQPRRGFRLLRFSQEKKAFEAADGGSLDDRVMRDMALGALDAVISERALMQRYGVPHGTLVSTLRRLMRDQLVEPSFGRGWIFADVGPAALADSYRFRQIVEPAAILSDAYAPDAGALQALDREHAEAIEAIDGMARRRLFDLDARFHALVARGANSQYLTHAIERQNNIRRVNEYIGFIRLERIRHSMVEHRGIIAAVLTGDRQLASALMRVHLQVSERETFLHLSDDLELVRTGRVRLHED